MVTSRPGFSVTKKQKDAQYSKERSEDEKINTRKEEMLQSNKEKLHMSAGIGLHVIMNQNFNINFEFGKCFDKNDGTGLGINIGLNYIF